MNPIVDAAFGREPGRWPLPAPTTPDEQWQRAVAAGGQGRYASALAELDGLARAGPDGPLTSLMFSTRASFLRQLGGHVAARAWDGRAWAAAGSDADAGADALIGLAADALGLGRYELSDRLLRRAAHLLGSGTSRRLPVRLAWVNAELAMAQRNGADALRHAKRAVDLAAGFGSARHVLKSQVVLAAAWCCAADLETSRSIADDALTATERAGLIPLSWALASLLADIGSGAHTSSQIHRTRERSADLVRTRGGTWTAR